MGRGESIYELVQQTRPVVLVAARATEARWSRHGITVAMRAVLEVVLREGPRSVPQHARTLDITRQAVQQTVDQLRTLGHLTPLPNPAHRTSPLLAASQGAVELFESLHADEVRAADAIAAEFSDAEIDLARQVLASVRVDLRGHLDELLARDEEEG